MVLYQNVNGKWENWYIELYELYPCGSREELGKREGEVIRLISNLNKKLRVALLKNIMKSTIKIIKKKISVLQIFRLYI